MKKLSLEKVGLSLGIFFSVIYALCVAFDLLFPQMAMYPVWQKLLPGFTWLSLGSFLLGLVETFFYADARPLTAPNGGFSSCPPGKNILRPATQKSAECRDPVGHAPGGERRTY